MTDGKKVSLAKYLSVRNEHYKGKNYLDLKLIMIKEWS